MLSVSPSGAHVSYKCGAEQSSPREVTDSFSVTCLEPSFSATASKPGFEERTETLQLTPGDKKSLSLTLAPKQVQPLAVKHVYGISDLKNWPHSAGQFEFRIAAEKRRRVKWVVAGRSYSIDGNKFKSPNTKGRVLDEYEQDGTYTLRIDLTATTIVHSIRRAGDGWERLDRTEDQNHNLLQGAVAFPDQDKLASFSFREQ